MAKYELCFEKNGQIKKLDLSCLMNSKKLIDLDLFTSKFENLDQLLTELLTELSVDLSVLKKFKGMNMMVTYTYKKETKTIPVMYKSARKYIFNDNDKNNVVVDVESVRHKLHSLCKDLDFLDRLANYYNRNILLGNCIHNIIESNDYDFYSKDLYKLVQELFADKVFPSGKFYYGGLRNITLFMDRYESLKQLKETKQIIEEEKTVQYNTLLTNDGDPFFPPNSEEEARYLRKLEEQKDNYSIESHPHYRR